MCIILTPIYFFLTFFCFKQIAQQINFKMIHVKHFKFTVLQTAKLLKDLHMRNLVTRYVRSITPERKAILNEKLLASSLFRQRKKGYEESVAKPFVQKREGIF